MVWAELCVEILLPRLGCAALNVVAGRLVTTDYSHSIVPGGLDVVS